MIHQNSQSNGNRREVAHAAWVHRRCEDYEDQDNPGFIYLVEDWESKEHHKKYQSWRDESGIAEVMGPFQAGEPRFNYFDKQDI